MNIKEIKRADLEKLINTETVGTRKVLKSILKNIFKEALRMDLIIKNIVDEIEVQSENSIRKIPIIKEIRPILKDLINQAIKRNDNKITRYNYNGINYALSDYLPKKIKGISRHTPHEARHTTATVLKEKGIPLNLIARMLGHSNGVITEKVYIHENEEKKQQELQKAVENIKIG